MSRRSMNRTTSFREQLELGNQRGRSSSNLMPTNEEQQGVLAGEIQGAAFQVTAPFQSKFEPSDMRQLALVAHNHMKPAMKEFIQTYTEVLKKFRITGTQTTMRMCKTLWGEDDPDIEYGLTCTSGPLGGDAQIAALMCMEDLGAIIFFVDPLSAHPHQADIDSLIRLCNCGNVIVCPNPTSAMSMMHTFKCALEKGSRGMIPSFFETLESPAVAEYKHQQELALAAAVAGKPAGAEPDLTNRISLFGDNPFASIVLEESDTDALASLMENENEDEDDYNEMLDDEKELLRMKSQKIEKEMFEIKEDSQGGCASDTNDLSASTKVRVGTASMHLTGVKPKRFRTRKVMNKIAKNVRNLVV